MSDENKVEETKSEKKSEKSRGDRGEVGTATPALTLKSLWHNTNTGLSLKAFARGLAKEGDQVAKDWLANKRGRLNQKRSDANIKAATEASQATKAAKRKKK